MSASASPSITATSVYPDAYLEAEILCGILADNGMEPAILFDQMDRMVFFVDPLTVRIGAVDIARQVVGRFDADEEFRENVVQAVANVGHLLAPTPGINADLKSASAEILIAEVLKAGWQLHMHFGGWKGRDPQLSYFPVGDRQAPNSHMLLRLLSQRFEACKGDPEGFAAAVIEHALANNHATTRAA